MTKKEERQSILDKYGGNCAYCGEPLQRGWHLDHLIPVIREIGTNIMRKPENDTFKNMMPSCPSCNIAKSSLSLEVFRDIIEDKLNQLSCEANYRTALRYGLVKECPKKIVFYFEKRTEENCDNKTIRRI